MTSTSEPFDIAAYQHRIAVRGPPKTQMQLEADKYREHFMILAYEAYKKALNSPSKMDKMNVKFLCLM